MIQPHKIEFGAYLNNQEKCLCGNTSFFSSAKGGHTMILQCGQCETIYSRENRKEPFIQKQ